MILPSDEDQQQEKKQEPSDDLAAGQVPAELAADLSGINGPISDVATELVAAAELHLCG